MKAAEIVARKDLLAALEAEFQEWMGSTNAAITRLNAATAGGDTGLFAVANAAIIVVGALNPYHQILLKAIAVAAALVPDPVIEPPPVLSFPAGGLALTVGAIVNLTPYGSKPGTWSMESSQLANISSDGKLTALREGNFDAVITLDA